MSSPDVYLRESFTEKADGLLTLNLVIEIGDELALLYVDEARALANKLLAVADLWDARMKEAQDRYDKEWAKKHPGVVKALKKVRKPKPTEKAEGEG